MPRHADIRRILVIGSGPIVIGQACEFDYSGTQACKALRAEGCQVVLINSNPATIMTDPQVADRTYVEPLTAAFVERVIEREKPQAVLATVGGQTALNVALELSRSGALARHGALLLGLDEASLRVAEDRRLFRKAMEEIGASVPASGIARTLREAESIARRVGFPAIVRPSFTMGGAGGGIAYNVDELASIAGQGLSLSPIGEVLIEQSVIGWKEFELEVMRDRKDNFVVVCTIENLDAMGIHTGDSITVAPAQTLTDREYQQMRDLAARVIRRVGVQTGGANIQFGQDPATGRLVVIEMNPRVSRSSALASKATGFPIAKIAARLALGYTLDEIPNDITRKTPACFEPALDYVVVKVPRWNMEKFPQADATLTTSMKSVGEVMAIGRTFKQAFQKALRALEVGRAGFGADGRGKVDPARLDELLRRPTPERMWVVKYALQAGYGVDKLAHLTRIDPWFLGQLAELVDLEGRLRCFKVDEMPADLLRQAKRSGFADRQIAYLTGGSEDRVAARRMGEDLHPVFKRVDTCAAEFEAHTPYLYSSYDGECEAAPTRARKVLILGSGPNRIGQGIEFDYACVHAAMAAREEGFEAIMLNSNPETVSTDYDTSDRLYFEPVTFEDVMAVVDRESPEGVMVQFGGQTPLGLARRLADEGVKVLGTTPDAIDLAEDRELFRRFTQGLGILMPASRTVRTKDAAVEAADAIGYPVLVRPSFVLGGRAMFVAHDRAALVACVESAVEASNDRPVLIDRFLEDAVEGDLDLVCDGDDVLIGAVMQHIEEAGVHSGDSSCVIPPPRSAEHMAGDWPTLARDIASRMARHLGIKGLMNMQFALKDGQLYVLEVNPRASRTVPFVSKATGVELAKVAARVMLGRSLKEQGLAGERVPDLVYVKACVFPFSRFGYDTLLGPEMRSTGEVMGVGRTFGEAFAKAQIATGFVLPARGTAFVSVNDADKPVALEVARRLAALGFSLMATEGTARALREAGLAAERTFKVNEGRPHIVDHIKNARVQLVINTPLGRASWYDEVSIRREAFSRGIPVITTIPGAWAAVTGIEAMRAGELGLHCLQDLAGRA